MTHVPDLVPDTSGDGLRELGIVTLDQLAEIPEEALASLKHAERLQQVARRVRQDTRPVMRTTRPMGVRNQLRASHPIRRLRAENAGRHRKLLAHLGGLTALSRGVSLAASFPAPGDQLTHGTCVGFATSDAFEFLTGRGMSPWAAHRAAKEADGIWHEDGTLQYYALAHFYRSGHLQAPDYTYVDWRKGRALNPLSHLAAPWKIDGFVDLLAPDQDYGYIVDLIRAIVDGRMLQARSGDPVPISIALYENYNTYSMETTGMLRLNLPGEQIVGGHAMLIVGYRDADDPTNPFDIGYFIARNSWGDWAAQNPFGLKGHALIPYAYLADPERLFEAYWLLR